MSLRALVMASMVALALASFSSAQSFDECDVARSVESPDKVDVYCSCVQRLKQMNLSIARLTVNQRECPEDGLELNWAVLEDLVAPSTFVVEGAHIYFSRQDPSRQWNSSISNLEFNNCSFGFMPSHAFFGLKVLETLRISQGVIDTIQSGVFSDLSFVHLIEITNSSVARVNERAFANLPSLRDLAFAYTTFDEISSEAVYLPRKFVEETPRCGDLGRSIPDKETVLREIMGRQLPSTGNLSLPEYGTRFLLFKNNIKTIRSLAFSTETLGFFIVGGNRFDTIESAAFSMELYNECEISAALFVGNIFLKLETESLVGLRGRDGASFQTFIALANNTFHHVEERGFMLSENLVIFTVEENKFHCKCDNFEWILSNADSPHQRELEKQLVLKGTCEDGMNLVSYTSLCTDNGEPTTTEHPEEPTEEPQDDKGSSAVPVSSLFVVTSSLITIAMCAIFA